MSDLTGKASAGAGNPAPAKNRARGVIPSAKNRGGRPQKHLKIGDRYGHLVVIGHADAKDRRSRSVFRCDCGKVVVKPNNQVKLAIKRRGTASCGCQISLAHIKHGGCRRNGERERLFNIWSGMRTRCGVRTNRQFKDYGGRGIRVCVEWQRDYATFRDWAITHGYADNLSIDRIDNDGNYEPSNCRWVDQKMQCKNRRTTVYVTLNGVRKTLVDWCNELNFPIETARWRHVEGWRGFDIFKPKTKGRK